MSELAALPVPPALLLLGGAVLMAFVRGRLRQAVQVVVPLCVLFQVLLLTFAGPAPEVTAEWMGQRMQLLQVDALRSLFGIIFALMAVIGSVYALHVESRLEHSSAWAYAAGALGVTFAGDLLTFILFWELMAVGSVMLVVARRTARSYGAALRYIAVHALGGTILLAGILAWLHAGHPLALVAIPEGSGLAGWLILTGVAVNVALPPLNAWLPDAYGEATVTGSVFLSAYTTKTAVFALVVLFPGWSILLWGGVAMALYGVVYAVLENNIRRLLAYHIISQVGYMVAAVGMGTPMALDGAGAHAFSHILYKSLLFMGAGAVIHATGKEKLTELGGIWRAMPVAMGLYAVGAMSISGFPLFNGFISKSIVVTAASQGGWPWAEVLLVLASIGTFLHTGLKLLWFMFISPVDRKHDALRPLPRNMYVAMGLGAFFCTLFGVWPGLLYRLLPYATDYHPYTLHHVVQSLQLLTMTAFAFWFLFDKLKGEATESVDTDWFYRKPLPRLMLALSRGLFSAQEGAGRAAARGVHQVQAFLRDPLALADRVLGRGLLTPAEENGTDAHPTWEDRHRPPLGTTLLVVLMVFAVMAIANLIVRRLT
jgi:multicomponent Na+:H+ antiporter subunit D